jgi:curved DNA-binding protein CbpA
MTMYGDPWEILNVDKSASKQEIKAAYRALARQYHPDVTSNPEDQAQWLKISWAWEMIENDRAIPVLARPAKLEHAFVSLFSPPRSVKIKVDGPLAAGSELHFPVDGIEQCAVLEQNSKPGSVLRVEIDEQDLFLILVV